MLLYVRIAVTPPPFHAFIHVVFFLTLVAGYTCYSDGANNPRWGSHSTNAITRTSMIHTPTDFCEFMYDRHIQLWGWWWHR